MMMMMTVVVMMTVVGVVVVVVVVMMMMMMMVMMMLPVWLPFGFYLHLLVIIAIVFIVSSLSSSQRLNYVCGLKKEK